MPPPKLERRIQPPPLPPGENSQRQTIIIVATSVVAFLLILLLVFLLRPENPTGRGNSSSTGETSGSVTGSSVAGGEGAHPESMGAESSVPVEGEETKAEAAGPPSNENAPVPAAPEAGSGDMVDAVAADGGGNEESKNEDADLPKTPATIGSFSAPEVEFFGTRSKGNSVAFVVDVSGSMASITTSSNLTNFELMKRELLRSIDALEPGQTCSVIGFNDQPIFETDLLNASATKDTKRKLGQWMNRLSPDGGTNPLVGMNIVFQEPPEVVFLLSDGEFPPDCVRQISAMNQGKSVINTISLGMDADTLKEIAQDGRGQFRKVQ